MKTVGLQMENSIRVRWSRGMKVSIFADDGAAGTIPIFVKCERTVRKFLVNKICNNLLLFFDRSIVSVEFPVDGDSAAACNVVKLDRGITYEGNYAKALKIIR